MKIRALPEAIFYSGTFNFKSGSIRWQNRISDATVNWSPRTGNPSEWPYINLGKFYYERGKRDQGLALLKRAVEINPQNDIGQYHLGKCLFALGLTEKARDAVEKAIDIHSKSPDYFYFLANI